MFIVPASAVCDAKAEQKLWDAFKLWQNKPIFHTSQQSPINYRPIEKISHHIWFASRSNHKNKVTTEVITKDFQYLLAQYAKMDQHDSHFKHIFWTNDETLIPMTVEKLGKLGNIEVRNIDSLQTEIPSLNLIKDKLEKGIYGVAIDAIKYEVVRIFWWYSFRFKL